VSACKVGGIDLPFDDAIAHEAVPDRQTRILGGPEASGEEAIELIRRIDSTKRVIAWFPPRRHGAKVAGVVDASMGIGRAALAGAQFSEEVTTEPGHLLRRPSE